MFEEALLDFPGTCIIVSHDRYFLNRIPTRIVELTCHGIENYLGTYDYYVEKKQQQIQSGKRYLEEMSAQSEEPQEEQEGLSSAERRRLQKEKEAEERRLRRHREAVEAEIEALEGEIGDLEAELCREEVIADHMKLAEISRLLTEKKDDLDEKYEKWLELQQE